MILETCTTESQTNVDEENNALYTGVIKFNKGTNPKVEYEKAYCRCLDFSKAYMQYHIALHMGIIDFNKDQISFSTTQP